MTLGAILQPVAVGEIPRLLEFVKLLVRNRPALYVSCPITSGKRKLEAIRQNGGRPLSESQRLDVLSANFVAADSMVARISKEFDSPVVAPALLPNISGWDQDDYNTFWGEVISGYCADVAMSPDWEYSNGCVWEFYVAQMTCKCCREVDGGSISLETGLARLDLAIEEWDSVMGAPEFLRRMRQAILLLLNDSTLGR